LVADDREYRRDFSRCYRWQAKPLEAWQMRDIGSRFIDPKLDNIHEC